MLEPQAHRDAAEESVELTGVRVSLLVRIGIENYISEVTNVANLKDIETVSINPHYNLVRGAAGADERTIGHNYPR